MDQQIRPEFQSPATSLIFSGNNGSLASVWLCLMMIFGSTAVGWAADSPVAPGYTVVIETNRGNIELKLFPAAAPKACENFTRLAAEGYYNGTVFHRVIEGFMIQGGDPTASGSGGRSIWGEPFEDEFSESVHFDKPGMLAMANAGPATNGSQFFITLAATPHLNGKHTIFGEVLSGMDVVQSIGRASVDGSDRPVEDQRIIGIRV